MQLGMHFSNSSNKILKSADTLTCRNRPVLVKTGDTASENNTPHSQRIHPSALVEGLLSLPPTEGAPPRLPPRPPARYTP